MIFTPILVPFLLATFIFIGLAIYARQKRSTRTGQAFFALILCALLWAGGFVIEIAATDLPVKVGFAYLEFVGITLIPFFEIYLAAAFIGWERPRAFWAILLAIPLATNLVIWTNPLHHWFYGTPSLVTTTPFPVLSLNYQFWFYFIHAPCGYLYSLLALIVLVRGSASLQPVYRIQGMILVASITLPLCTDLLYVMGITPVVSFNFTPAVFSLSGLLLAWGLFRFQFLDLLPLARDYVFENINDGIIVLDTHQRVVDLNGAARKIVGMNGNLIGKQISSVHTPEFERITTLLSHDSGQKDIEFHSPNHLYVDLRFAPVFDRRSTRLGQVITLRDITERINLFHQMEEMATRDDLTGAINRRHYMELCQREVVRAQRDGNYCIAVLILDLDNFKEVNDTYGHTAGDAALVMVYTTIHRHLRSSDLFGRIGGDEFSILLPQTTAGTAMRVAERLSSAVRGLNIPCQGRNFHIDLSVGIVCSEQIPSGPLGMDHLLELADQALYIAKHHGRGRVELWQTQSDQALP